MWTRKAVARHRPKFSATTTDWFAAVDEFAAGPRPSVGSVVDVARAQPIEIRADLMGRVSFPHGPMAIDALLASMVCLREGLPPPLVVEDVHPVEIPIVREPAGRFHLASFSVGAFERFGPRWINRRFPIGEAQALAGPKLRRINIAGGPCKSYRIPLEAGHVEGDLLRWYAIGDREAILDLLAHADHLGKRRGVGLGRVIRWEAEVVEPWGPGFPVVSAAGEALRTLPLDWPGLTTVEPGYRTLSYPYWRREAEVMSAMATRSL